MAEQAPGLIGGEEALPGEARQNVLWRAAGWYLQLRWASILVVAVLLGAYFTFANDNFLTRPNALTIAQFLAPTAYSALR